MLRYYFTSFLILNLFSCISQIGFDLNNYNVKGNVKSMKELMYVAVESFGESKKGERTNTLLQPNGVQVKYDERGKVVELDFLNLSNELVYRKIYKYDSKGNEIEHSTYNSNGSLRSKSIYEYNDNETEFSKYYSDGSVILLSKSKYDEKGDLVEWESFNDESVVKKKTFKYDNRGNQIEKKEFYSEDFSSRTTSKFDDRNNLIEKNEFYGVYIGNTEGLCWKFIYEYDEKGNCIEYNKYNSEGVLLLKTITKYDSRGLAVDSSEINPDGSINERWINVFDEYENQISVKHFNSRGEINSYSSKYHYDENGNWIRHVIPGFIIERSYEYYQ